MKLIACVDDKMGMMFHRRRQSRDRAVIENIVNMCGDARLWIAPESEPLLKETDASLGIAEDFLNRAGEGEYCLVETWPEQLSERFCEEYVETLILYHWNRSYPADQFFPLDLQRWQLNTTEEFAGTSHEHIRKEIYDKKAEER